MHAWETGLIIMVSTFYMAVSCRAPRNHTVYAVLNDTQLARVPVATMRPSRISSCLLLTQCGRHTTCVVAADVGDSPDGVALRTVRIVRFVDNGWAEQSEPELRIVRDGAEFGVCDPQRRWWVPNHGSVPFRLVELSLLEHARVSEHLEAARPWDLFKYIQLLYLTEDGFTGGRDALAAPAGYGSIIRTDRWYVTPAVRG